MSINLDLKFLSSIFFLYRTNINNNDNKNNNNKK